MSCSCHKEHCSTKENKEIETEDKKKFVVTLIRVILSITLALLGLFLFNETFGDKYLGEGNGVWLNFAIMFLSWLVSGYDIFYEGILSCIKEKNFFNEKILMIIASIGAFSLRAFGPKDNEFFEAVMIVALYQVGEMFEDFASERSHKAIKDAVGLRAKTATLLENGISRVIDPQNLKIGDKILIKVGDIVPADGILLDGNGELDMSSLTGEFLPVSKKKGDFINSGTILKSGLITVEVSKSYSDSTVSKILSLVEESENKKSKADKFITSFSKIYTPIVCVLALLIAVIPPLIISYSDPAAWTHWLYTAICLLIISCPCAVVVSVPLSYFAGIGLSSKKGIIVKGGAYFDKLADLGLLVSDKTGTLTYGEFAITKLAPKDISEEKLEELLLAGEAYSNHPLAMAIKEGKDLSLVEKDIKNYQELAGYGTSLTYKDSSLLVGNHKLLEKEGVPLSNVQEIGTIIYVAYNHKYVGYALLNDKVRENSGDLIGFLRNRDIDFLMLTGDKKESATKFASDLGITDYKSELLPEDKRTILEERIANAKKPVAYIGDGINDAPSIALADVGIAMGGSGSDMAIENADVVIMNDDPKKVVTAIKIAHKTKRRATWNVIIALTVKFLVALLTIIMPYVSGGAELPLFVAVLCDTGLTAFLILFSVSLLCSKKE